MKTSERLKKTTELLSALGHSSIEEFEEKEGFKILSWTAWTQQDKLLFAFVDPFFDAMTSASILRGTTDQEYRKSIKYKKSQLKTLFAMKNIAIFKIKKYLADEFFIDIKLIKTSDIIFNNNRTFKVSNTSFSYDATLANMYFKPTTWGWKSTKNHTVDVDDMLTYFYGKGLESITDIKIVKDDN